MTVRTLLDPYDPNSKVYEAHYGMTQEWAQQLLDLGYNPGLALSYDRYTGDTDFTLSDLAAAPAGTEHETFHFVLNNTVVKDNRIPPYGFAYEPARRRNALPVPENQFGGGQGSNYDYFDVFDLTPPGSAVYATVELMYQPTSWEYIQFLYLANNRQNPFLADEGVFMLEAWLATGMAEPYVMTTGEWGQRAVPPTPAMWTDTLVTLTGGKRGQTVATDTFGSRDTVIFRTRVVDEGGAPLSGAQVFLEVTGPPGVVTSVQGFTDALGNVDLTWKVPRNQTPGTYSATVIDIVKNNFLFDPVGAGAVTTVDFFIQ
jgi:hypothetical protein